MNLLVSVFVNGERQRIAAGTALDTLVAALTPAPSGVAAALNETVVPRGQWSSTSSPRETASKSSPPSKEADPWPTIPLSSVVRPSRRV